MASILDGHKNCHPEWNMREVLQIAPLYGYSCTHGIICQLKTLCSYKVTSFKVQVITPSLSELFMLSPVYYSMDDIIIIGDDAIGITISMAHIMRMHKTIDQSHLTYFISL